jgi:integral membrane protein (TIGR00529 family)
MEMLQSVSVLIRILTVFCMILFLNRMRVRLDLALFAGAVLLGLWMKLGPLGIVESLSKTMTQTQTITLILIVGIILIISRVMQETGHLVRIVKRFGGLSVDPRIGGSVLPAVIGLLPMPGGALFSAPMVDSAFQKCPVTGESKTAVNYWFRHIWEFWWPLYPGVVLAVALLEVETWQFMAVMIPMTAVSTVAGVIFILRPARFAQPLSQALSRGAFRKFLWETMPILMVVVVIVAIAALGSLLNLAGFDLRIQGGLSILPGLLASLIWVCSINHVPMKQLGRYLLDQDLWRMLMLLLSILVFKGIMTESQAVLGIRDEMMGSGIPVVLVILLMPFFSGFVTGIAVGFVGTAFPLVIPLFPQADLVGYLSWGALAYTFGCMGMMLSPVHLCFLVSRDYFKARFLDSYRYLLLPVFSVLMAAAIIFLIPQAV